MNTGIRPVGLSYMGKAGSRMTAQAGGTAAPIGKNTSGSTGMVYNFNPPINRGEFSIQKAEIILNRDYEIINAYINDKDDEAVFSCVASKGGKVFIVEPRNSTQFQALMNTVANRIQKINKTYQGSLERLMSAINSGKDLQNETGKQVAVRRVFIADTKESDVRVNRYSILGPKNEIRNASLFLQPRGAKLQIDANKIKTDADPYEETYHFNLTINNSGYEMLEEPFVYHMPRNSQNEWATPFKTKMTPTNKADAREMLEQMLRAEPNPKYKRMIEKLINAC